VVANTEEGLENSFVPLKFSPRVVRSGMSHWWQNHWFGDNANWTQTATYQTGKSCETRYPKNSDVFMKLIKVKDYSTGKMELNTLCLQTFNNRMSWAYRSKTPKGVGFVRECIELDEVWNQKKRRC